MHTIFFHFFSLFHLYPFLFSISQKNWFSACLFSCFFFKSKYSVNTHEQEEVLIVTLLFFILFVPSAFLCWAYKVLYFFLIGKWINILKPFQEGNYNPDFALCLVLLLYRQTVNLTCIVLLSCRKSHGRMLHKRHNSNVNMGIMLYWFHGYVMYFLPVSFSLFHLLNSNETSYYANSSRVCICCPRLSNSFHPFRFAFTALNSLQHFIPVFPKLKHTQQQLKRQNGRTRTHKLAFFYFQKIPPHKRYERFIAPFWFKWVGWYLPVAIYSYHCYKIYSESFLSSSGTTLNFPLLQPERLMRLASD